MPHQAVSLLWFFYRGLGSGMVHYFQQKQIQAQSVLLDETSNKLVLLKRLSATDFAMSQGGGYEGANFSFGV